MAPQRNSRLRAYCALVALAAIVCSGAQAASDWEVIKVGRWDYLSVDNIAKFYGFPAEPIVTGKSVRLDSARNNLELTLDSREAIVNGVRNWLCFPVIQHSDGRFLVSRIDLAKTIEPQFRPHLIRNLGKLKTVVIDPGHGGIEKGAASSYGLEKNFALDVALQLKPMLEARGLKVVMTRTGDDQVPLPQRARIANATRDSIFVSIHFNATDSNPHASGFEIYSLTPRGAPSTQDNHLKAHFANMQAGSAVDAASLVLSTSVYHAMLGYLPEFDRGVKRARFAVLRLTNIPAILVEGGFMSERQESQLIAQKEFRVKLAQSIAVGIENYRGLVEKQQRPMLLADYRRQLDGVLVARDGNAPAGAAATPQVFAASNQQAGAMAQITSPLRREPSEQITLEPAVEDALEKAPESAPPPPAIVAAALAEPPSQVEGADTPAMQETPEDPASEATQPASSEALVENTVFPAPADSDPVVGEAPSSPAPAPARVRKYWVLKFDPPPKFRQ